MLKYECVITYPVLLTFFFPKSLYETVGSLLLSTGAPHTTHNKTYKQKTTNFMKTAFSKFILGITS